ncbi:MAG: MogA/MoaB family molybdenum cofactor biosynthesis protein [Deltaproteobacteria bacterium]|nr:MogA/MoaB family molybdenum cofactor biosynthesis protein [Deltaproteobacteria bacterium]
MSHDHDGHDPHDHGHAGHANAGHVHDSAHPHDHAHAPERAHTPAPPHPDPYLPAVKPGPKSAAVAAPGAPHDTPHTHSHGHDHGHVHDSKPPRGEAISVPAQHKAKGPRFAKVYVITCSDTRTEATDEGGRLLRARLADAGHVLSGSAIVPDEAALVLAELDRARKAGAQVVLITGGTGLGKRDATFEAVQGAIARPVPGFGELFRMLSYAEIGAASMLSRACAGVCADGLIVFAMPGSVNAVRLAVDKLILPELLHLLGELTR